MMSDLPIDPVFGFLEKKAGTTLVHGCLHHNYSNPTNFTLCGVRMDGWYGDDDLTIDDVECKKCQYIIEKMRREMNER
jgi:hypothetical protein